MEKYVYFTEDEFNKLTPSCSLSDMDSDFMHKLDYARSIAGVPFILNSAFRSKEWDISKGRSGNSWHTKGMAVDIRCTDSNIRFRIVEGLISSGFRGIIVYPRFIHVDLRDTRKVFLYGK